MHAYLHMHVLMRINNKKFKGKENIHKKEVGQLRDNSFND